jgi:hypothetical protein
LCSDDGQPGSYQLVRRVSTDKQAIAVFLDRIPFRADPTFAAMLDIGIGIDFRICDRTNLGNLFSIGFSREEE